jgi:hypothetical protein
VIPSAPDRFKNLRVSPASFQSALAGLELYDGCGKWIAAMCKCGSCMAHQFEVNHGKVRPSSCSISRQSSALDLWGPCLGGSLGDTTPTVIYRMQSSEKREVVLGEKAKSKVFRTCLACGVFFSRGNPTSFALWEKPEIIDAPKYYNTIDIEYRNRACEARWHVEGKESLEQHRTQHFRSDRHRR